MSERWEGHVREVGRACQRGGRCEVRESANTIEEEIIVKLKHNSNSLP